MKEIENIVIQEKEIKNIVIIEDEEDISSSMKAAITRKFSQINKELENAGSDRQYTVMIKSFTSAGIGYLGFGRGIVDFVVVDLNLEGSEGLDVVKYIREAGSKNGNPFGDPYFVIYSAMLKNPEYHSKIIEMEKTFARGFHGFIEKPNMQAVVERAVELLCKGYTPIN